MTGFDRLSYQSRWLQVEPERKFLLWLLLMALAFTLPAWGQALTLALTAALTCWLLRVSFWRWCCRRATCCLTSPPRASIHAGGRR